MFLCTTLTLFESWCQRAAQVVLSGFVGVFFEKVLKSKVGDLSVWDRNVQVCVSCARAHVCVCVCMCVCVCVLRRLCPSGAS